MSAIAQAFERASEEGRPAFIPFLVAGDPDLETTAHLIEALAAGGADVIELGVPWSDPIADGPTNQAAAVRALAAGTTLGGIFNVVHRMRERIGVPIVLFTYFNPIHARGIRTFAEQASASGVDGVLCVDLPPEEADYEYVPVLRDHGLDTVFLLAPTSTPERIKRIAELTSGFAYYVSRTGVTGTRADLPEELLRDVKRLRKRLPVPLAVGFGISTPDQAAAVGKVCDGVVVGSALVDLVARGGPDMLDIVELRARELSQALKKLGRGWFR